MNRNAGKFPFVVEPFSEDFTGCLLSRPHRDGVGAGIVLPGQGVQGVLDVAPPQIAIEPDGVGQDQGVHIYKMQVDMESTIHKISQKSKNCLQKLRNHDNINKS